MHRSVLLAVAAAVLVLAPGAAASCCSGMTMSQPGLSLTESFEGLVQHVYNDPVGNPTCCYGHLVTAGETFPSYIPLSECQRLLQQDLGSAESCVQTYVNVPLNNDQFDALVDFTFNLGCGALQSSTLLRLLNEGEYSAVPAQMNRFVYASGQQLPGLVRRRAAEGQLWNGEGTAGDGGAGGGGGGGGGGTESSTVPPSSYVGTVCTGGQGTCIDTDDTTCSGSIYHGLCPGPSNIICCDTQVPQSCADGTGQCINTDNVACTGSIDYDECPGASNILCCIPAVGTSCDGGQGSCIDTSTTECGQSTLTGLCPGPANIRCCPSGSGGGGGGSDYDYYGDYSESNNKRSSSSGLSEGATIGIVCACVAVVALVAVVAMTVFSRKQQAAANERSVVPGTSELRAPLMQGDDEAEA